MQTAQFISITDFCTHYSTEISFIRALDEFGLIEITTIENNSFIDLEQLHKLEQYARFHYDLDINIEGIQAIDHLLANIRTMQEEINSLKNKLRIYETQEE